jgi:hypothetical protein
MPLKKYIHTTCHSRFIPKGAEETSQVFFYLNYLAMRNTIGVTGGKSSSGVSAINPLVAFYDIHGRKSEVLFTSLLFCDRGSNWASLVGSLFSYEVSR